eukprot:scaffold372721_cov48-Prasinocladus_malaysianus.AAC.1
MDDLVSVLFNEDHGFADNDIVFLSNQLPDRETQVRFGSVAVSCLVLAGHDEQLTMCLSCASCF